MRIVVLGWGNEARGDDALGPLLLRHIERRFPGVATVEDYQLQIEHALDLRNCDAALFVDAFRPPPSAVPSPGLRGEGKGEGRRGPGALCAFHEIHPRLARTPTTHALSPEAVLDVYARVVGRPPPPAFALGMHGESFGLGEGLSPVGQAALAQAEALCERLLAAPSLPAWRAAAAAA